MARPRQITNEQILAAMKAAVLSFGPAVPLEQVASSIGVTGPALLKRFGSRQALMIEALRPPERPEWIENVLAGPTGAPLQSQLTTIFTGIAEFMADVVPCMSALRESGVSPQQIFSKTRGPEAGLRALQQWMTAARAKGLIIANEAETAAFAMLGAIQMRAFLAHLMKQEFSAASQHRYLEELAAFFTRALQARPSKLPSKTKSRRGKRPARTP